MKTKVGIIGYGLSGRIFHGALLKEHEHFHVKMILTSNEEKAQQAKEDFPHAIVTDQIDVMLNKEDLEVIIIASPNNSHYDLTEKCLKAGKHVVIEKPFTVTTHDALRLMDLEKDTNKMIAVYHNRRFDGDFQTVKDLIHHDKLGRLVEFESHFDRFRNTFKENAWREQALPGSGILYDLGSHLIDQALNLFGLPQEVYADISCQRRGPADDSFEIIMYYSELKVTLKAGMLVKEGLPRFILHGTKGSYIKYGLDVQEGQLKEGLSTNDPNYGHEEASNYGILQTESKVTVTGKQGNYRGFYDNLYQALRHGGPLVCDSKQGFDVIRIIEAALHSHQLHKRIPIKH